MSILFKDGSFLSRCLFALLGLVMMGFSDDAAAANKESELAFRPIVHQYTSDNTPGHFQNWCIKTTQTGLWVVCNGAGLLIYDGDNWELIRTPNDERITSFALDEERGRIYTGFNNHLGFFELDSSGVWTFQNFAANAGVSFTTINSVQRVIGGYAFLSDNHLFHLPEKGEVKAHFISDLPTRHMLVLSDALVIFDPHHGPRLFSPEKGLSDPLPQLKLLKNRYILSSASDSSEQAVLGSYASGLYLLGKNGLKPLNFNRYQVNTAITLIDKNHLAIGTQRQGIFIVSFEGKLVKHITLNELKIEASEITGLSYDPLSRSLLATTDSRGILQVIEPLNLETLAINEVYDNASAILIEENQLYFGVRKGLEESEIFSARKENGYWLNPKLLIDNFHSWHIAAYKNFIAAVSGDSVAIFDSNDQLIFLEKVQQNPVTHSFVLADEQENKLFTLFGSQLVTIREEAGKFHREKDILSLPTTGNHILKHNRTFWIGSHSPSMIRLTLKSEWPNFHIKSFDSSHGLARGSNQALLLEDQLLFANSKQGLFLFDKNSESFRQTSSFFPKTYSQIPLFHLVQNKSWLANFETDDTGRGLLTLVEKSKEKKDSLILPNFLPFLGEKHINDIDLNESNQLALAGHKNIFSADLGALIEAHINSQKPYLALNTVESTDDVVFRNHRFNEQLPRLQLKATERKISLQVSLIDTQPHRENRYRFFDGQDWTPWQSSNRVQLSLERLDEFDLKIEAQSRYGLAQSTLRVPVNAQRFWHENYLTRSFFVFALAIALALSIRSYTLFKHRRLVLEKQKLESIVQERTRTIKAQSEQLVALEKSRNKLFSNVSHEFRTPLTLILSPIDALLSKINNQDTIAKLSVAKNNALRLLDLVNQILDINRLEQHGLQLNRATHNFSEFILAITENFFPLAEEKNIALDIKDVQSNIFCFFDAYYMERIIYNLLSNAFKFTESGGSIQLSLDVREIGIEFIVVDSGVGMSDEVKQHVFERFFQADANFDPVKPGTGIGLSFVQELVRLHEGTIECDSQVGQGTSFTITLPISQQQSDLIQTPMVTETEPGDVGDALPDQKTLLIIEDNDDLRQFIGSLFSDSYRLLLAPNGEVGIEYARRYLPDAIVSDLMMPKVDGFEVVETLKSSANTNYIPVLVLTAKANKPDTVRGLRLGADDYLTKPFDNNELITRVQGLISSRERLKLRFSNGNGMSKNQEVFVVPLLHENQLTDSSHVEYSTYRKSVAIIREHIADPDFNVQALAKAMAMDRSNLYRKLNHVITLSTQQLIRDVRLSEAALLLKQNSGNVSEVAYGVGFSSVAYFSRSFKQALGVPPSEY